MAFAAGGGVLADEPLPPLPPATSPRPDGPVAAMFARQDSAREDDSTALRRPIRRPDTAPPSVDRTATLFPGVLPFVQPSEPTPGFAGRSSILPSEDQADPHFVPIEDRWRVAPPPWDRYGKDHPFLGEYPYAIGRWFDPYHQNVLKGDYPIVGNNTFLNISGQLLSFQEYRQVPTGTTLYEAALRPGERSYFQRPDQYFTTNFLSLTFDLFHGDAAFKPVDWRFRFTPVFNLNNLSARELAVVNPNVLAGTTRTRDFLSLQEGFFEAKLADLSPDYDFVSMRLGSQPFLSDFRGFLYVDTNDAVRIFGNRLANRDQFNLVYVRPRLKDTNSQLNTFKDRGQNLIFANYYRQDFLVPGYTIQLSAAYDQDRGPFGLNKNRFQVRPDSTGISQRHQVDAVYLGLAGDGHIGRINITHQFYWALGRDALNPLANRGQSINAQMFAIEASIDRDWARFRSSFFWASGDNNINDGQAKGFDTILDAPNFAGGAYSYWNRQQLQLFRSNIKQRLSLVPDLRSDKFQGQANFVNPGIVLPTFGVDLDLSPRLRMLNNLNILWFDKTNVLQQYLFSGDVHRFIGYDLSVGFDYKPIAVENVNVLVGSSVLLPGLGFRDIFVNPGNTAHAQFGGFVALNFNF